MKPRVFIASSVEGLDVAYAVQENLDHNAEITVWSQGVFELSQFVLEPLLKAVADYDFAIFVFSPDDLSNIKNQEFKTVRDNVIFEFGLFMGNLGRNRVFMIIPRSDEEIHIPTDLLGLIPGVYNSTRKDDNLLAALGPVCNKIKKNMDSLNIREKDNLERYEPLVAFHETFRQVDWNSLLKRAEKNIDIVVYYFDSWVNANYESLKSFFKKQDTRLRIFVSDPRIDENLNNIVRLFPEYSKQVVIEKVEHTGERLLNALRDAGGSPDRLEFYYVPHLLNYSVQCIDENIMVMSFFEMYREMKIDSPALVVDLTKSEHLKKYWEKELDGLLNVSEKVVLNKST